MKPRTYIPLLLLAVLGLGLAALIALLARGSLSRIERAAEDKASTLARTVVSAIEGVMRHGPDQEGRIYGILDEVSRDPEVVSVGIASMLGEPLVVRGAPLPRTAATGDRPALTRSGDQITVVVPFNVESGCMAPGACACGTGACKCGAGGEWEWDLPAGAYRLVLVTDLSPAHTVRGPLVALASVGVGVLLILFVVAALLARSVAAQGALARNVALEQQRRRSLESLGLVAAGLAHEIRNPLGAIRGYAQLLAEQAADPASRERAAVMLPELDRVGERLEEFLGFARKRKPSAGPVDLSALAAEVVALFRPDAEADGIALAARTEGEAIVDGDAAELKELLTNLVLNALQACGRGGRVVVSAGRSAHGIDLTVTDTGPGIPPGDVGRVFEPYFTTKARGSGLGLAISRRIAEDHGAALTLENAPAGGAVARLAFPGGAAA